MDRWSIAVAGVVVGVALFAGPALAEDPVEALPDIAAAPEYTVTPPRDFADVKLASAGLVGSQSVAVNPKNANVFVVAYINQGACWVRTSTNAGRTWAGAKKLPMPGGTASEDCIGPALTWAPDGTRVYAAYLRAATRTTLQQKAVVSVSTDKGATWSTPKKVQSFSGFDHFVGLATPLQSENSEWLYFVSFQYPTIYFSRSNDQGKTWAALQQLVTCGGRDEYVSYPSIAGGPGGEILVSWGSNYCGSTSKQQIEVRRSSNFGDSFSPAVVAVPGNGGRTAIAFGTGGAAHLVYSRDDSGSDGPNYVFSTKAPYSSWSSPVLLSDNSSVRGISAPVLSVSRCSSSASILHVAWLDERLGSGKYNLYYTRKVARTGEEWSADLRVSATAVASYASYGYYYLEPGIAASGATAVALWGQGAELDGPRPVRVSRIAPGVRCP